MKQIKNIIYHLADTHLDVILHNNDLWVTQKTIAKLFNCSLEEITTQLEALVVRGEFSASNQYVDKGVKYFNLNVIIALGYCIHSKEAVNFRIWAMNILKEYALKGFVVNKEQLEQGNRIFDKDYFRELLETVRSIRASERRIYQQITDIFAECSIDYNKDSPTTKEFFAMIQNKFHYAITSKTAPEIIFNAYDSLKDNMGLTTWKNAPNGRILKQDTIIAKNYLTEKEIKRLERTVSGYFDYIEELIEQGIVFTMQEFTTSIDRFLSFRNFKVLQNKGSVSRKEAENKAFMEYEAFNKRQKIESDFDKFIQKLD